MKLKQGNGDSGTVPPGANSILNILPESELKCLLPLFDKVKLKWGEVIYRHNDVIDHVYFPDNAAASLITRNSAGQVAEVGVIGSEGIFGVDALLGAGRAFNDTMIQIPGESWRINIDDLTNEFKRGGVLQTSILNFTRLLMIQISQTAFCNRLHTIAERLARRILICRDQSAGDDLPLTHEFLSLLLGASRVTVTTAALDFQRGGLIENTRGHITILDRLKLENICCECYRTVKNIYHPAKTQKHFSL